MNLFFQYDLNLLKFINIDLSNAILTDIMLFITDKHNWYPFILAAVVYLLYAGRKLPHPGSWFTRINPRVFILGLILCIALTDQVGTFLKHNVKRTRPNRDEVISEQINCRLATGGRRSFPSNHSANSAGLAMFTAMVYPPLAIPAAVFSLLVGFSRIYLGVHYPSDVLVGWLIGALSGLLIWRILRKKLFGLGVSGFVNMFRFRQLQVETIPSEKWEKHLWSTLDGVEVNGFLLKGGKRLIIFVHGLGGSMMSRVELGEILNENFGYSFLLIPLCGTDNHPTKLTSGGTGEVHDILGALKHAASQGFSYSDIVIYGTSMGGASAIKACALAGEMLPRGLIVHGAFTSFFESAKRKTGQLGTFMLKFLMPGWASRALTEFTPIFWLDYLELSCGVEYIYGEYDRVSPPEDGELMAGKTESLICRVSVLPGIGHPTGQNASESVLVVALKESLDRIYA